MPPKKKMNLKMHHRHHHHHNRVKNDTKTLRACNHPTGTVCLKNLPGFNSSPWLGNSWMDFSIATVDGSELHQLRLVVEIPSFARFYKHIPGDTARFLSSINCTKKATWSVTLNLKRFETYQRPDGVSHTPFFRGAHAMSEQDSKLFFCM